MARKRKDQTSQDLLAYIESRCVRYGACLIWQGAATGDNKYGAIRVDNRIYNVHRLAYELRHGSLGTYNPSKQVCHTCDDGFCIEDTHHFLGSTLDNVRDMISKGRTNTPIGEQCSWSKLTEESVRSAREARASGESCRSIARRYNLSHQTISRATNGTDWRHVK